MFDLRRLCVTLALLLLPSLAVPCTVAVVSGAATPDGRPLLWKNRDTGHRENRLQAGTGPRFAYLALVNAEDSEGEEAWAGANEAGLCIMNSASYNLDEDAASDDGDEGRVMRRALGECATVGDFEQLLARTVGDRVVGANFGVIDSAGGAAFFETTSNGHVRFDATDRRVAPEGYLLRTNYSLSGEAGHGAGYIRFDRMAGLLHEQVTGRGIGLAWLLLVASRDMVNGLTAEDPLARLAPAHRHDRRMFYAHDTLVRETAASTVVFHGVREGAAPDATVMWTRLGHPLCSVALPVFVSGREDLGVLGHDAALDRFAVRWHDRLFPYPEGGRNRYLDLAPVVNRADGGLLPILLGVEEAVLEWAAARLDAATSAAGQQQLQRSAQRIAVERLCRSYPTDCAVAALQAAGAPDSSGRVPSGTAAP